MKQLNRTKRKTYTKVFKHVTVKRRREMLGYFQQTTRVQKHTDIDFSIIETGLCQR